MVHNLTTEQLRKLVEAYGNGRSAPRLTDDPRVNHAIDCILSDEGDEPYDEQLYVNEIREAKAAYLL